MNPRDRSHLFDILDAAHLAQTFVEGMDYQSFLSDIKTQSAVLYRIAIIGEATKRLSTELRTSYPDIPWTQMAGMRDKLVHDYKDTNFSLVWDVLQRRIPDLIESISPIANELTDDQKVL